MRIPKTYSEAVQQNKCLQVLLEEARRERDNYHMRLSRCIRKLERAEMEVSVFEKIYCAAHPTEIFIKEDFSGLDKAWRVVKSTDL